MNTNSQLSYQLPSFTGLVGHGQKVGLLRDESEERTASDNLSLEAKVRSGDYFVTLATVLDSLSRAEGDWHTRTRLEDMVSDLIYLQDHYTITKNKQSE